MNEFFIAELSMLSPSVGHQFAIDSKHEHMSGPATYLLKHDFLQVVIESEFVREQILVVLRLRTEKFDMVI